MKMSPPEIFSDFNIMYLLAGIYPSNFDVRYTAQKTQSFIYSSIFSS